MLGVVTDTMNAFYNRQEMGGRDNSSEKKETEKKPPK